MVRGVSLAALVGATACSAAPTTTVSTYDPCAFDVPQSVRDQARALQNTAPVIHETTTTGGAPDAPAGGAIQSGTYFLTESLYYYPVPTPPGSYPVQETLVVDASAGTLADVASQTGVPGQKDGNVPTAATYTVQGTTMTWALDACTDTTFTHQAFVTYSYTATGSQLVLQASGVGPATYAVSVFTRQ